MQYNIRIKWNYFWKKPMKIIWGGEFKDYGSVYIDIADYEEVGNSLLALLRVYEL